MFYVEVRLCFMHMDTLYIFTLCSCIQPLCLAGNLVYIMTLLIGFIALFKWTLKIKPSKLP